MAADAGIWRIPLAIAFIGLLYTALVPVLDRFQGFLQSTAKQRAARWGIDQAERGVLKQQTDLSDEDLFQLEKRAFFSRTWLFVCHNSRFEKPGDYHTFDLGGLAFFVVLGKDGKIRAFQNICRHRAYTVVRKECGSSTRFTCRYHGWQYDDQGKLVKAPKFERSPGFKPEDNGLFEIKLILTRDGLIYVNFDATTISLPFNNVESGLEMKAYSWLDGVSVETGANWKVIGNDLLNQAHSSRVPFGWIYPRKTKAVRLLGPLSVAKDLDDDLWSTVTLLPVSSSVSVVRMDLYSKPGHKVDSNRVRSWRWMLEELIRSIVTTESRTDPTHVGFSYECGGRMIELSAILEQHQRSETLAKRKLFPAIRVTGFTEADQDAAALCDAVDDFSRDQVSDIATCARIPSFSRRLQW